jgi:hypothetical protein
MTSDQRVVFISPIGLSPQRRPYLLYYQANSSNLTRLSLGSALPPGVFGNEATLRKSFPLAASRANCPPRIDTALTMRMCTGQFYSAHYRPPLVFDFQFQPIPQYRVTH